MKKLLLLVAGIIAFSPLVTSEVKAQDNPQNVVKLSLSNLVLATPTLFYERALNEKLSAQLGAFYTGANAQGTKLSGLAVMPELRIYPGKKGAPRGFYLAPFFKYTNYSLSEDVSGFEAKATASGIGGGLVIGGQWLIADRVSIDLYFGPSITAWSTTYEDNTTADQISFNVDGTVPGIRTGLSVGVAF